jgi:hypothetical protein
MNKERLQALVELLERQDPALFDMTSWAKKTDCGTTCCALGLASMTPEFQAQGLNGYWDNYNDDPEEAYYCLTYGEFYSFEAGAKFFELSTAAADYLFMPEAYCRGCLRGDSTKIKLEQVVEHIEKLLDGFNPQTMEY